MAGVMVGTEEAVIRPLSIYADAPGSRVIRRLGEEKWNTQSIGILSDRSWYVSQHSSIEELADDLAEHPSIQAVAVLDDAMRVLGVIVRRDIMGALARPYGRDVLRRRPVREHAEKVPTFDFTENIYNVNEILGEALHSLDVTWYALTDKRASFRGLFSSREMLIYMSDLSKSDLDMARSLQKKLTGEVSSYHEMTFDLVASSKTAKGVGGDYYSVDNYSSHKWVISICDVSGKGMAASLITSIIWGMSSIFDFSKGIGEFIRQVNRYLFRTFEAEKFITGMFLDFNARSGKLTICDMGHSYIYLYRGGRLSRIKTNSSNLPIGITPENEPVLNKMRLQPNDIILVPTDGLLEQENLEGALYTPERIQSIIRKNHHRQLDDLHTELIQDFDRFRGAAHLHDDVTYVLLKYFENHGDDSLGA
ncbi:MAG: SpoIIE family protein phosphatase [Spirochaetaceae bacterium]|nr:SpoIIE family protein phosphatase [Spirochaetaceae bacterium]MDT8299457.1 SpoIIE family protein phosphatase [Spirochaetaceae bacterium]